MNNWLDNLTNVEFSKIKKLVTILEKNGIQDDTEVTFFYLMSALFPKGVEELSKNFKKQYTLGYIDAQREKK